MVQAESVIIAVMVVLGIASIVQIYFLWMRRRKCGDNAPDLKLVIKEYGNEQMKDSVLVRERLNELENRIVEMEFRHDLEMSRPMEPNYEIAIDLARTGMNRDDLMRSCGLIRAEADLMIAMYRGLKK